MTVMGWAVLPASGGGTPIGWFPFEDDAKAVAAKLGGEVVPCALDGELVATVLRFPAHGCRCSR